MEWVEQPNGDMRLEHGRRAMIVRQCGQRFRWVCRDIPLAYTTAWSDEDTMESAKESAMRFLAEVDLDARQDLPDWTRG